MKQLILHIGHQKTGSSAIQSFLAQNRAKLKDHGIDYPDHRSLANAEAFGIGSGNYTREGAYDQNLLELATKSNSQKILISNEGLFHDILRYPEGIVKINDRIDLCIILFIRDPLDDFISAFSQAVKRGGYIDEIDNFLDNFDRPRAALRAITLFRDNDIPARVLNYSRYRDRILQTFLSQLNLPEAGFVYHQESVNRSLSAEETYVARAFNRFLGKRTSRYISDPFCEEIRNYLGTAITLDKTLFDAFRTKCEEPVRQINALLPPSERYALEWPQYLQENSSPPTNDITLTKSHIDILAKSVAGQIHARDRQIEELDQQLAQRNKALDNLREKVARQRTSAETRTKKLRDVRKAKQRIRSRVKRLKQRLARRRLGNRLRALIGTSRKTRP